MCERGSEGKVEGRWEEGRRACWRESGRRILEDKRWRRVLEEGRKKVYDTKGKATEQGVREKWGREGKGVTGKERKGREKV